MIVQEKLPSGHLGHYSAVSLSTDLTGEHHEQFLSSPEGLFDRTVASVIGSLLTVGDVNKLHMIDLMHLFFIVRAMSVSSKYSASWTCRREITPRGGQKQECGGSNQATIDVRSLLKDRTVKPGFQYPKHDAVLDLGGTRVETKIFARFLTVAEEFEVHDELSALGIQRHALKNKAELFKYTRLRLLRSIQFEDARANDLTPEQKDAFLKAAPMNLTASLFEDLARLDSDYGPDLTPREVTCQHCKGVSRLAIPFSPEFILSK